ncbi:MAG: hypothetical protein HY706_01955 [Candidatus Hydrogenedentes bacterium]|nr:hypothetical protein [Candidatus Hydrogenedentota bacterium]
MAISDEKRGGVTPRAIGVGLVFVLLECGLVHYVDQMIHGSLTFHLVPAPAIIVLLFVLVWGVNTPLRGLRPGWALTTREVLVVYCMLGVGMTAPSIGLAQVLVPALAAPVYYASPSNKFQEIFQLGTGDIIPKWLAPQDFDAIKGIFSRTSIGPIDWGLVFRTWAGPLSLWGLWVFVFFFVYVCMMSIVRKQWVQREQLTFAYNVVPEYMSLMPDPEEKALVSPFWRNRWTWAGFLIPFVYHLFANLYVISPVFPRIPIDINLEALFTEFPWNGIGYLYIYISIHSVAFFMLLTEEMLFSLWFFWVVNKALTVLFYAFGINETYSDFFSPVMNDQGTGAFLGYFLVILWMMRSHLRTVVDRAVHFRVGADEAEEPLTYRMATWGLIGGVAFLVAFLWVAGANPFWSLLVVSLILVYWMVLTRLVAEAGLFMSQGPWPVHDFVAKLAGTTALTVQTWTVLGFFKSIFLRWYTIMPAYILGGYKLADRHKLNTRRLVFAMLLAIFVSIVAAFATTLWLNYSYGGLNLSPWKARNLALEPFETIRRYYDTPLGPDLKSLSVVGVGGAVTLFLSIMRMNFTWWPFHPLGYLTSNLYIIHYFWIHILIAWVGVRTITKYGGLDLLRKLRPFFVGMVIGGLMSGGFWWVVDYFYYVTTHWVYAI